MDPIQIDVVGLQSLETRFHSLHHVLALIAGGVRVCAWKSVGVFSSEHDALAMASHKIAEKRFAGPIRVDIGSVDEIAAGVAEGVVYFPCLVLGRTPTPVVAEGHRAERRFRNSKSAVSQKSIFHIRLLCSTKMWLSSSSYYECLRTHHGFKNVLAASKRSPQHFKSAAPVHFRPFRLPRHKVHRHLCEGD